MGDLFSKINYKLIENNHRMRGDLGDLKTDDSPCFHIYGESSCLDENHETLRYSIKFASLLLLLYELTLTRNHNTYKLNGRIGNGFFCIVWHWLSYFFYIRIIFDHYHRKYE